MVGHWTFQNQNHHYLFFFFCGLWLLFSLYERSRLWKHWYFVYKSSLFICFVFDIHRWCSMARHHLLLKCQLQFQTNKFNFVHKLISFLRFHIKSISRTSFSGSKTFIERQLCLGSNLPGDGEFNLFRNYIVRLIIILQLNQIKATEVSPSLIQPKSQILI